MPAEDARIADAVAFMEDIKGHQVSGPEKLPEIAANQSNRAQHDAAPGHRGTPYGRSKAAQNESAEDEVGRRGQTQRQIAAELFEEWDLAGAGTIEMLVNNQQSRQDQRLLLGKKAEEIGDQDGNVGEPGSRGPRFRFRQAQIEQKGQQKKDAQLQIRNARDPGDGFGVYGVQGEKARGDERKQAVAEKALGNGKDEQDDGDV